MRSQVGLGSITMNKASGGGGIQVGLFQVLKDDAVKVLHSIGQKIWKIQQWKAQHSENEDHGVWSHHFMGNRWGNSGNSVRLYIWGLQNHWGW